MLEYLNSDTLFNTVAMLRPERDGLFLVVEGSDDRYTIKRHANESVTVLSGLGGKSDLLAASAKVDEHSIPLVYFLVDSDYDRFIAAEMPYGEKVIASDGHDLVMDLVLVDRSVIHRVLDSHVRGYQHPNGAPSDAEDYVRRGLDLALPVGVMRMLSVDNEWGLRLRDFPFGKLSSAKPTVDEILEIALRRSPPLTEGVADIVPKVTAALTLYGDQAPALIGDHDFFAAVARVMSDDGFKSVKGDNLVSSFLAATHCSTISRTGWFKGLARAAEDSGQSCFDCPCGSAA